MATLRISIYGISCLADAPQQAAGFHKRLLLPTDNIADANHPPHIAFVEVAELDFYNQPGTIPGLSDPYNRDGITYRRFELYGKRFRIENVNSSQGWEVSSLFNFRIPKMKLVLPSLSDHPRDVCFDQSPPANLVSAHFDMTYGRLTVGDIDAQYTAFNPTYQWPRRRLAVAAVLELDVSDTIPMFVIEDVSQPPGVGGTVVRLKPDVSGIAIGNLPLSDLTGQTSTDDPEHDFLMFYNLADPVPANPPVPSRPAGLDVACTPTGWP